MSYLCDLFWESDNISVLYSAPSHYIINHLVAIGMNHIDIDSIRLVEDEPLRYCITCKTVNMEVYKEKRSFIGVCKCCGRISIYDYISCLW